MKRRILTASCSALMLQLAGCASLSGSWKAVQIEPPNAPFPVEHVTFGEDRQYTASWSQEGEKHTSTGLYRWNGRTLTIEQLGREPRHYRGRVRMDGRLELRFEESGEQVSAVLERADNPSP